MSTTVKTSTSKSSTTEVILPRVTVVYPTKKSALTKLDSIYFKYGMPAIVRYKTTGSSEIYCLLAVGIDEGIGKYKLINYNTEDSLSSIYQYTKTGSVLDSKFLSDEIPLPQKGDIAILTNSKNGTKSFYIYTGTTWADICGTINSTKVFLTEGAHTGKSIGEVVSAILNNDDIEIVKDSSGTLISSSIKISEKSDNALKRVDDGLYVEDLKEELENVKNSIPIADKRSIVVDDDNIMSVGIVNGGLI